MRVPLAARTSSPLASDKLAPPTQRNQTDQLRPASLDRHTRGCSARQPTNVAPAAETTRVTIRPRSRSQADESHASSRRTRSCSSSHAATVSPPLPVATAIAAASDRTTLHEPPSSALQYRPSVLAAYTRSPPTAKRETLPAQPATARQVRPLSIERWIPSSMLAVKSAPVGVRTRSTITRPFNPFDASSHIDSPASNRSTPVCATPASKCSPANARLSTTSGVASRRQVCPPSPERYTPPGAPIAIRLSVPSATAVIAASHPSNAAHVRPASAETNAPAESVPASTTRPTPVRHSHAAGPHGNWISRQDKPPFTLRYTPEAVPATIAPSHTARASTFRSSSPGLPLAHASPSSSDRKIPSLSVPAISV